jgi:D-alanyl-D-alanine carboxypeptidase (penicillin-binding protein 5/6)
VALRQHLWPVLAGSVALAVVLLLIAYQLFRPLPAITPTILQPANSQIGPSPSPLPWPNTGSVAVAVDGLGMIGAFGPQSAQPMASTAKIMTASLILQDHPLGLGEQGPLIPVTPADVANYQLEKSQGQSVFAVQAGEQLSEYQALEALLIPSGNNVAELLAGWDAGSIPAFVDKMNLRAKQLGLRQTHYEDVSGVSNQTVGSPAELIVLAQAAMHDPVFARIVGLPEATLPVAGRVFNVNGDLGQDRIIGVKTGSADAAGACLVFAADTTADNQPARIYGAVMGLPTLDDAFSTARKLIEAINPGLHYRNLLSTLQTVAEYQAPWGDNAFVFPGQDVNSVVYDGMTLHLRAHLRALDAPAPSGTSVGSMTVQIGQESVRLPLETTYQINQPDIFWRLARTRLF